MSTLATLRSTRTCVGLSPPGSPPRAHALQALFLRQAARLAARVDAAGDLVPHDREDRARWDGPMIAAGMEHLGRATTGNGLSPYHLEAAIAACHALAPTYRPALQESLSRAQQHVCLLEVLGGPVGAQITIESS